MSPHEAMAKPQVSMSRKAERTRRRTSRRKYIWIIGSVAVVSALLYWEQAALLYVLSTLMVCALLLVVAFSDLEGRDRKLNSSTSSDDVGARFDAATSAPSPTPTAIRQRDT